MESQRCSERWSSRRGQSATALLVAVTLVIGFVFSDRLLGRVPSTQSYRFFLNLDGGSTEELSKSRPASKEPGLEDVESSTHQGPEILPNLTTLVASDIQRSKKTQMSQGNGAEDVERSHWEPLLSSVAGVGFRPALRSLCSEFP